MVPRLVTFVSLAFLMLVGSEVATAQSVHRSVTNGSVTSGQGVVGVVFLDANGNGSREAGERGLSGIAVSDQANVVFTDDRGQFALPTDPPYGIVFVSTPDTLQAVGTFWRRLSNTADLTFAMRRHPRARSFTFVHASDTHLSDTSLPRLERLRQLVDSLQPAFVLVTGDLVRDALRVSDSVATSYYEMLVAELGRFAVPVFTVPGNHEIFGVERHLSLVSQEHPLYGKKMYRHYLGPDYYSFTYGGVHFVGLNTIDVDDLWYHGHVDSLQLAWLVRDLSYVPDTVPVVSFNHIPFLSTGEQLRGYTDESAAPTVIRIGGVSYFRHVVRNARAVISELGRHPFPLALGGHVHMREQIRYEMEGHETRFYQAPAVVGPVGTPPLIMRSGIVVYRVVDGVIDDGVFVPLE